MIGIAERIEDRCALAYRGVDALANASVAVHFYKSVELRETHTQQSRDFMEKQLQIAAESLIRVEVFYAYLHLGLQDVEVVDRLRSATKYPAEVRTYSVSFSHLEAVEDLLHQVVDRWSDTGFFRQAAGSGADSVVSRLLALEANEFLEVMSNDEIEFVMEFLRDTPEADIYRALSAPPLSDVLVLTKAMVSVAKECQRATRRFPPYADKSARSSELDTERLREKTRSALKLYKRDLTPSQVAERLGLSAANARQIKSRLKRKGLLET